MFQRHETRQTLHFVLGNGGFRIVKVFSRNGADVVTIGIVNVTVMTTVLATVLATVTVVGGVGKFHRGGSTGGVGGEVTDITDMGDVGDFDVDEDNEDGKNDDDGELKDIGKSENIHGMVMW
jgi:hypothetical protein